MTFKKLKEYADNIKDDVEGMKEISQVVEVGALEPNIQINVDINKMSAAQISFGDIITAIGNENILSTAGTITTSMANNARLILRRTLKAPMRLQQW